nr:hypothetical protein [Tanacetum cinerariifolium]
MTAILKQFQATPPLASVKVVEEICITYGGAHLYYQCLTAGGNTFLELRDNIQGYVAAAVVNYNQEGVVVSSSSLDRSTKSCLGGIMVSMIFLEGLEEEACVDA